MQHVLFFLGGFGEWMNFLTLPNILKLYNPHLVGFSSGTGSSVDEEAGFNVGEPGALSRQMLYQAKVLVERIKKDPRVHFHRDWKVSKSGKIYAIKNLSNNKLKCFKFFNLSSAQYRTRVILSIFIC